MKLLESTKNKITKDEKGENVPHLEITEVILVHCKWKSKNWKDENGRITPFSKCAVCDSKKSKLIKEQEASGLLSSLGIEILLTKIPLLDPLSF